MPKIIYESEIGELLFELTHNWRVVAPTALNNGSASEKYIFSEIKNKNHAIALDYPATILPPKEYLLPASETLFNFKDSESKSPTSQKTLTFGLSLEDLEGIFLLDQIFARPIRDEVYKMRREKTAVVAVDRFSPPKDIPFDLYLMRLSGKRLAGFAGSRAGQQILKMPQFKMQGAKVPVVKKAPDELFSDKDLSRAVEKSKGHKIWDDLSEICFGCGICTYVCPLCYCFETHDEIDFAEEKQLCGRRCRTWDSCLLEHFAETAHHNFRPELRDRIYNWYFHKFVRMPKEYGFAGCVDCNRCVIFCPAKINYRKVLETVLADYKKLHRRKK